jgi:hypothetical protein
MRERVNSRLMKATPASPKVGDNPGDDDGDERTRDQLEQRRAEQDGL